ncbi:hypothetical protein [Streptomyces phaeofaciens]|uniref:hypothetical protein n=1 Tax=Streptomyces phaeofaciens TaxID=68254 RepID=UPI00367884AB
MSAETPAECPRTSAHLPRSARGPAYDSSANSPWAGPVTITGTGLGGTHTLTGAMRLL